MTLSQEELHRLAKLARLHLTDQEQEQACHQLSMVFDLFQRLEEIQTDGIEPLDHPMDEPYALRKDVPYPQDLRTTWSLLAPNFQHDLFLVPKIIES
jgi:aspartyl-tRNA(Asn)/glutamyl-tRNA(Gln) amidotransferase subunit C